MVGLCSGCGQNEVDTYPSGYGHGRGLQRVAHDDDSDTYWLVTAGAIAAAVTALFVMNIIGIADGISPYVLGIGNLVVYSPLVFAGIYIAAKTDNTETKIVGLVATILGLAIVVPSAIMVADPTLISTNIPGWIHTIAIIKSGIAIGLLCCKN